MKKKHPPSYYRYREKHPTIGICVNKELKATLDKLREKGYLFSLKPEYRQYLKHGLITKYLTFALKKKNLSISSKANVEIINEKKWRITDGSKEYTIEDIETKLKVYEKMSYARLISYILDKNIDHLKALKEEYWKGYKEGSERNSILIECFHCNKKITITPNGIIHKEIMKYLKSRGWGHPACYELSRKTAKK